MYAKRFLNPEAKQLVLEMTSYIRKVFKEEILEHMEWMDEKTRNLAGKKLDQVSISPTFYEQLLCPKITKIPKAQKYSKVVSLFCAFGICACKSCTKNVDEIDPRSQIY